MARKVVILDGYTDEPAGLGVPPYIDVYPRYIAGAVWSIDPDADLRYYTIDQVRKDVDSFVKEANSSDLTAIVAGVVVPGKYIGGEPISAEELKLLGRLLGNTFTVLAGPVARFGIGQEGGKIATPPEHFKSIFSAVVRGDPEEYVKQLLKEGEVRASEYAMRKDYSEVRRFAVLGAKIITQHPNFGYNLTVELETYRGCSRWISGGCSFCIEPLYGRPVQRNPEDVILEMRELYRLGARAFRLGRQSDILVYGSKELGEKELPRPNPEFIERFFQLARDAIEGSVLHVDNSNPAVIAKYPEESKKAMLAMIEYHTPGDILAFGLENLDEEVAEINNLNSNEEVAYEAVKAVNEVGLLRGDNGMPHLLPGLNFIIGLPGERKASFEKNISFLERIYEDGFAVRRINIRKVLVIPGTRLSVMWRREYLERNEEEAERFEWIVRHVYDVKFLKRILPRGTILRDLYVEKSSNGKTYARQLGTYPLLVELSGTFNRPCILDAEIIGYKGRSVKARPVGKKDCTHVMAGT